MKQLKKHREDSNHLTFKKSIAKDETVEHKVLTPEEIVIAQAAQDKIGAAYGALIMKDPTQAGAVLLDFAKQKYGLDDQGKEIKGAGLEIINKKINSAIIKSFPRKKSVIDQIKNMTADNNQRSRNE